MRALLVLAASLSARAAEDPADLRKRAASPDAAVAFNAIQKLDALGDAAKAGLADLARNLMSRDAALLEKAIATLDPAKVKQLEADAAALRTKARANLDKLEKGEPVTAARQHHAALKPLTIKLNAANAQRSAALDALRRRSACAAMLVKLGDPAADDAQFTARAARAIGIDAADDLAIPDLAAVDEPRSDSPGRGLWFYRACRTIDAWNKAQHAAGVVNKWEAHSVRLLNDYREALGLMPLEIDPRLCEAARRHSKEMVDLKYFAHASPTPGRREPVQRMATAGYPAGWRENICANVGDPNRAFDVWFNSPGHHLAMTAPDEIAIGCGRWDNAWTHTFGHHLRLSTKDDATRAAALAKLTTPLKPQPDDAKLPPTTVTRVETEITVIDPKTGQRVTMPGSKK
ncbi:MAG TPA: CAP domain-containing protein [Tepidisphaeraceae bacterium]|nr:CAP domain-containing protein [Tepidisphaeraceae bacterium]